MLLVDCVSKFSPFYNNKQQAYNAYMAVELLKETILAPTTLEGLFSYPQARRDSLARTAEHINETTNCFIRSREACCRFASSVRERAGRLGGLEKDLNDQLKNVCSSLTCTRVYLKMTDELKGMGATPEEIYRFFCFCCITSAKVFEGLRRSNVGIDNVPLHRRVADRVAMEILDQEADRFGQPSWYRGKKEAWLTFCQCRIAFVSYLNGNAKDGLTVCEIYERPDWFDPEDKTPPDLSVIAEELVEDEKNEAMLKQQIKAVCKQMDDMWEMLVKKDRKAYQHESRWIKAMPEIVKDLPTFLLYLEAVTSIQKAIRKEAEGKDTIRRYQESSWAGPKDIHTDLIRVYAADDRVFGSPEIAALWLEAKFEEAGVVENAQGLIGGNFLDLWEKILNKSVDRQWWENLRSKNKRMFAVLYYEIRPSFSQATETEREYLLEFARENTGKSIEPLFGAISDVYRSYTQKSFQSLEPLERKRFDTTSRGAVDFSRRWLRNNWRWAVVKLRGKLDEKKISLIERMPSSGDFSLIADMKTYADETEKEAEELSRELLAGWQVIYILNPRQPDSLKQQVVLAGLEEEKLARFMTSQGVPHANHADSIIRVLEGLTVALPETDNNRSLYHAWGHKYFKIKRDSMRILCQVDRVEKVLKFYVRHRGDRNYFRVPKN